MVAKARVQKRLYYKIGEACKALGIQPYVLRYWETEFPALTPSKSRSGQRVYSEKELEIIRRIKELLYDEGYTIAGAKKKLEVELTSGALGEDRDEDETTPKGKAPAPVAPAAPPEKSAPARRQAAAPVAAEGPVLDTGASKRIETLVSGIEDALREAREIQALLGSKPSP
ncbi:MAG TPA: MerR family transcriptional regulator [Thermoanaerobaculia bacterium]|jgi:DNA-binding transcriptional MerR regulator|nr:MerR family transcriptional regulator [Thermoanaerobaculia bacterium]